MQQVFNQQVPFEDIEGVINMKPLIYDPKTKPMRYAGWLSFLQKFISVTNQSNQVRRLRLLIFTTCLIMALAVGLLFYPNNLIMSHAPRGHQDRPHFLSADPDQGSLLFSILGPNQSDPVWQLRLLAALSLVVHTTMGVLILPGDLQGIHATYQRVMLIMGFGVPIVVAVITLLVSIWLVPDTPGRSNWITGLSVANFSLLGGRLAVYWTIKRGTKNILRGEEIELMREVV